jgi:hypothetical protein
VCELNCLCVFVRVCVHACVCMCVCVPVSMRIRRIIGLRDMIVFNGWQVFMHSNKTRTCSTHKYTEHKAGGFC